MIHHLATILLRAIEQPVPLIHLTGAFLRQWPHSLSQAIVSAQLLRKDGMETQWRCQRCASTCLADVEWRTTRDGPAEPYHQCDQSMAWGAIPLDRRDLQRWHTSFTHLADAIAIFLDFHVPREEVIPERLWWLGGKMIEQRDVDIFLARGADWTDAPQLFARSGRMQECATPLVLVPCEVPVPSPFPGTVPVRSLISLLQFDGCQLHLRHEQLAETIRHIGIERQQQTIPILTPPCTTWLQVVMEFANDDYLQISVGKERHVRSFAEMGFADLRKPAPTPSELWVHLRTLAKYEGRIGWDTPLAMTKKERGKVRKWISDIRLKLQTAFPDISDNPFEPYQTAKAYQTKFILRLL